MSKILHKLAPPQSWKIPVIILSGIMAGLFIYLFYISRAYSYMSDEPSTCMNWDTLPKYPTPT